MIKKIISRIETIPDTMKVKDMKARIVSSSPELMAAIPPMMLTTRLKMARPMVSHIIVSMALDRRRVKKL